MWTLLSTTAQSSYTSIMERQWYTYTHNSSNNSNNNNVKLTQMQVNTSSESPQTPYQGIAAHGRLHTWTCPIQAEDNATTGYRKPKRQCGVCRV